MHVFNYVFVYNKTSISSIRHFHLILSCMNCNKINPHTNKWHTKWSAEKERKKKPHPIYLINKLDLAIVTQRCVVKTAIGVVYLIYINKRKLFVQPNVCTRWLIIHAFSTHRHETLIIFLVGHLHLAVWKDFFHLTKNQNNQIPTKTTKKHQGKNTLDVFLMNKKSERNAIQKYLLPRCKTIAKYIY